MRNIYFFICSLSQLIIVKDSLFDTFRDYWKLEDDDVIIGKLAMDTKKYIYVVLGNTE